MIYGMPHETPATFFDGVEQLLQAGISVIQIFPLLLFPGIDLASRSAREKYGFQTRFRLPDQAYGVYDDGKLVAVEAEEVIYMTRWSTEDDYFTVRRYGFFQQVLQGRLYFVEFSRVCAEIGIAVEHLIRHLTLADYSSYPALGGSAEGASARSRGGTENLKRRSPRGSTGSPAQRRGHSGRQSQPGLFGQAVQFAGARSGNCWS